jgi:hypothetical protein
MIAFPQHVPHARTIYETWDLVMKRYTRYLSNMISILFRFFIIVFRPACLCRTAASNVYNLVPKAKTIPLVLPHTSSLSLYTVYISVLNIGIWEIIGN